VRALIFPLLLLAALPARADEILDAAAFRTLSEGRVLSYSLDGHPFGEEQYFHDGAVIWKPALGACEHGRLFGQGEEICFLYEGQDGPVCWTFRRDGNTITAVNSADPDDTPIELDGFADAALDCPGPKVGS
jgi:hypothetical protein